MNKEEDNELMMKLYELFSEFSDRGLELCFNHGTTGEKAIFYLGWAHWVLAIRSFSMLEGELRDKVAREIIDNVEARLDREADLFEQFLNEQPEKELTEPQDNN